MDLLTVVMHELGHELGFVDLESEQIPDALMTESLGAGLRRLPAGATWVTDVASTSEVSAELWLPEDRATADAVMTSDPSMPAGVVRTIGVDTPVAAVGARLGPVVDRSAVTVLHPDWFEEFEFGGIYVG